jgi:transposase
MNLASGMVISQLTARHRAVEFKRFLHRIDAAVPAGLDVHLICDNSSTHKTPAIQRWLVAHPRFQLHFTPTYSSWLNLVERWFAELTGKWLKRRPAPPLPDRLRPPNSINHLAAALTGTLPSPGPCRRVSQGTRSAGGRWLESPAEPLAQQPLHRFAAQLHPGRPLDDYPDPR